MKKIKVKAIFKGENGSLGYEKDHQYTIIIQSGIDGKIWIERENGNGICPYESIIAFLNNWENVSKIF